MERPSDTLVAQAAALARRITDLAWAGDAASLGEVVAGVTDAALMELARRVGRLSNLMDAVATRVSGEVAARSARDVVEPLAKGLGESSAAAAVAAAGNVPVSRAADWCKVGQRLAARRTLSGDPLPGAHPAVAEALDAGRFGVEAAGIITAGLAQFAPFSTLDQAAKDERFLVEQAAILTATQLAGLCRTIRDRYDADGSPGREEGIRRRAGVTILARPDGLTSYHILTDPEGAGFLNAAFDARTNPRRVHFVSEDEERLDQALEDNRTLSQRRLDAIVSIARDSLKHDPGDMSGTAVTVLVTTTHEALSTGVGTASIFGVPETISAATARRLACEANIIPVVLGAHSQPLDVGGCRRLFSEAQRYAMAIRDGGCIWPGCDQPPGRCEAAHVRPWNEGGPTSLDNGVLFCRFHHRRFDNDGWTIRFRHGVPWLIPPPWIDPTGTPRPAGRPPDSA